MIPVFERNSRSNLSKPLKNSRLLTAELLSEAIARDIDEVSRDEQDSDSIFVAILNSITPIPEESEFE